MRKLIKTSDGRIVTAPFKLNDSMRKELDVKGGLTLALEAAGLFALIGVAWGSLFLINAYYGGL